MQAKEPPPNLKMNNEARIRIGRTVRNLPSDYHHFFTRPAPEVIDFSPYAPRNFRLNVNLKNTLMAEFPPLLETIEIDGRERFKRFAARARWALLWGHYFWRLSDLSRLRLEPVKLVQADAGQLEVSVYWRLKVELDGQVQFISGPMDCKSAWAVQSARIKGLLRSTLDGSSSSSATATEGLVLFSGVNRYVFDSESGYVRSLTIDRIEPKLDRSQWKWRSGWFEKLTTTEQLTEPAAMMKKE